MVFSYTCSYVTNFVSQLLGTVSLSDSGYSSKYRPAFTSSNVYLVRLIFFVLLGQSDIVAKLCEFSFKVFPAPFLSFAGHIQLSKFLVALTRQHAIYACQQRVSNGNQCLLRTSAQCETFEAFHKECPFCARCGPCRFHKNCSYMLVSVAGPAALLLSCALVVARTHSCPGTKVR